MSSFNLTASIESNSGNSYADNVGRAARAFVAALLAVKPEPVIPAQTQKQMSERQRLSAILQLNSLATGYDVVMPNQALELRYLAAHGY